MPEWGEPDAEGLRGPGRSVGVRPGTYVNEDGEILLAHTLSRFGAGTAMSCVVTARRVVVVSGLARIAPGRDAVRYAASREVVAKYRDAADALSLRLEIDPRRDPRAYVRTPGGAWAELVPVVVTERSIERVKNGHAKGVRAAQGPPVPREVTCEVEEVGAYSCDYRRVAGGACPRDRALGVRVPAPGPDE
jgi:hypothetical protein